MQDSANDNNYWVNRLTQAAIFDLWPADATPEDLEKLNAAPREVFVGRYGAVRRVLRTLLEHRITTPDMEPVVYEGGEFAGEFEKA